MQNTIHGLIKKRGEIAGQHKVAQKAADALKADLDAIDRALVLCGYESDPKAIAQGGLRPEDEPKYLGCEDHHLLPIWSVPIWEFPYRPLEQPRRPSDGLSRPLPFENVNGRCAVFWHGDLAWHGGVTCWRIDGDPLGCRVVSLPIEMHGDGDSVPFDDERLILHVHLGIVKSY